MPEPDEGGTLTARGSRRGLGSHGKENPTGIPSLHPQETRHNPWGTSDFSSDGISQRTHESQCRASPAILRERRSWTPAAAEGPKTEAEKPGTPTTVKCDSPAGWASYRAMPTRPRRTVVWGSRIEPSPRDAVLGGRENEPRSSSTPPQEHRIKPGFWCLDADEIPRTKSGPRTANLDLSHRATPRHGSVFRDDTQPPLRRRGRWASIRSVGPSGVSAIFASTASKRARSPRPARS
jgi:hypothetical protein